MSNVSIKTWVMAFRPKTLTAAVAPVLIGTSMAYGDGIAHIPTAFVCLLTALMMQIGTNLANDYYDFQHGADTEERIGPTRVTQAGLIKPWQVKLSFIIAFGLAAFFSWVLVQRGGWPLGAIAVISILSGLFYTAGPRPLGYMGLGDIFVLIFFGPVAVGGTYYVQAYEINTAVILAGFAPGLISAAILTVNNLRDMESDRKTNKLTLAVRFGRSFAFTEYLVCIIGAALIPVFVYLLTQDHVAILLSTVILFFAIPGIKIVLTKSDGPQLNEALAFTGRLLLIHSIFFSIGWIL